MPFEVMIPLREALDEMLQRIRRERQIRSPVTQCPECGHMGASAPPHVSLRAMILSVSRFGIDELEATRAIEKAWKAYEKANHLDVYGQSASANIDASAPKHVPRFSLRGRFRCIHAQNADTALKDATAD